MTIKTPDVKIEQCHEMSAEEMSALAQQYQSEMLRLNPNLIGASPGNVHPDVSNAVQDFRRRLNQSSKGVMELTRRGDERREDARKAEAAKVAAVEKKYKELGEANLAADRDHQRRLWVMASGSEDGFEQWWSDEGRTQAIQRRMREAESLVAQTWRG